MEKVRYTYHMEFLSETSYKAPPCYRILDDHGHQIANTDLEEVCYFEKKIIYCKPIYPSVVDGEFIPNISAQFSILTICCHFRN